MRVLFASGIDGFCHRYNPLHWAEQLATEAIASTVRAHADPRLIADLAAHDVLVLYRVPDSPWVQHVLGRAAALGRATVFAVDDMIVDPAAPEPPLLRARSADERRLWRDGVARYRRTLEACDALLATSAPIAAVGRALGKPTHLQRAGLAAAELALGAAAMRTRPAGAAPRLGYFSGTATHDADLASIAPVLAETLERHPAVEVLIVGPVALPDALGPFAARGRVAHRPLVPWTDLPALVASCTASLGPLEWRDPFVAAKGAVKYLEAAAVGVPVIASPTEAFRDAVRHGVTGWLASDDAGWRDALATVCAHPERAAHVGATAHADVALRFVPAAQGRGLAAFLSTVAAGLRTPHPAPPLAAALDERTLVRRFPGEVARLALEPADRPDHAPGGEHGFTAPLADGAVLAQRVASRCDGLCRLDVRTVTYDQPLDHTLLVSVRRDDAAVVATHEIWAGAAPARGWLAVELRPEARSAGRTYTVELRARGTGSGNALSFAVSGDPGEPYRHDGVPGAGPLMVRSFAAWDVATDGATRAAVARS